MEFDPERKKTQWERFEYKIQELNRKAPADTEFKLLYLGRHGQGYHNVAEAFYGTEAWEVGLLSFLMGQVIFLTKENSATGRNWMVMAAGTGPIQY